MATTTATLEGRDGFMDVVLFSMNEREEKMRSLFCHLDASNNAFMRTQENMKKSLSPSYFVVTNKSCYEHTSYNDTHSNVGLKVK